MTTPPAQDKNTRSAALAALSGSVGAFVIVCALIVIRVLEVFRPEGIAWRVPVDQATITTAAQGAQISGTVTEITAVVPNLDAGGTTAVIATLAVLALAALIVAGSLILLAANLARGQFFTRSSALAFTVAGWAIGAAACAHLVLNKAVENSILTALGLSSPATLHPVEFFGILPLVAVGTAVGLIGLAFRHGLRLQRDTAGLV